MSALAPDERDRIGSAPRWTASWRAILNGPVARSPSSPSPSRQASRQEDCRNTLLAY
jgi:hypothetical protein